jgi:YD repeat-containing protein
MSDADELISFLDDVEPAFPREPQPTWKVAVIDDDPAVHEGTRFALYDYKLGGQGLEILSAHSAREGRKLLADHPDIAVVLLDVVMETETAGLDLVSYVRSELRNDTVRIILRTGQPGQAPERRVIVDYDINDYKAKTELTADKLFTSMTAALRSYQQLQRMLETRRGLEIIIEAASTLFDFPVDAAAGRGGPHAARLVAGGGLRRHPRAARRRRRPREVLDPRGIGLLPPLRRAHGRIRERERAEGRRAAGLRATLPRFPRPALRPLCPRPAAGARSSSCSRPRRPLSDTNRALVELFTSRLSVAFDNVILYQQLQDANLRLEERVLKRTAELKSANRRLAAQTGELRRANRFKTEILGTIAHDLKNPLGVIMGRSEMLSDFLAMQPLPETQVRDQIRHVRDSAKRLTGMVDSLISDAMNDALDITVRREPLDLLGLVGDVVEANRPLADRKNQTISVDGPDSVTHAVTRTGSGKLSTTLSPMRSSTLRPAARSVSSSSGRARTRLYTCAIPALASRRRTSEGSSAGSSGFRPSRPGARARPGSACRSPSASSTSTEAASRQRAPGQVKVLRSRSPSRMRSRP